ncbi:MAG TPA: DMT family transporter [Candidatus Binatia bacterium]|jgi:drug/metabolite transporter (DMT)-like permease|nr:DMT family transporter [Candidatus Binatia bacterium]
MSSEATAQVLALITSVLYASALVSARAGMRYSNPTTVTLVSILMQNLILWTAVLLTRGVPAVPVAGILLFTLVGIFQLGVRLFAYTGVAKIGASRSSALQSVSPLISAAIAITMLGEQTSLLIIVGTVLIVVGIILISWKPKQQLPGFHRWHLLLPIGAAFLSGINHPIRRYVLTMANEPLFFAALMGAVSLGGFLVYLGGSPESHRLVWNRQAIGPFLATGLCETLSILFIITAISLGRVVVVVPIATSYPVWSLIQARIFLRDVESVNWKIVTGILSVVAGNFAIHFGR